MALSQLTPGFSCRLIIHQKNRDRKLLLSAYRSFITQEYHNLLLISRSKYEWFVGPMKWIPNW